MNHKPLIELANMFDKTRSYTKTLHRVICLEKLARMFRRYYYMISYYFLVALVFV